jgi:hypothetical protein
MDEISRIKRIVLFLNVSAYKLALMGASVDNDIYVDKNCAFGIILNYCGEFLLFKMLSINTKNMPAEAFITLLVFPLIFHACIYLLFPRDIKTIVKYYNSNYGKYCFPIYCILTIIGVFYSIYCKFES